MADILEALSTATVEWEHFEQSGNVACDLLQKIAMSPDTLLSVASDAFRDPRLRAMAERFDYVDQFVLYDALDRGLRIRLHHYTRAHADQPHDHRWSFSSLVLRGRYRHALYNDPHSPGTAAAGSGRTPVFVSLQKPGDQYTIHHSLAHSVVADEGTLSIILRSPAVKDRFLMTDRGSGEAWFRFGRRDESAQLQAERAMPEDAFDNILSELERLEYSPVQ